MVPQSNAGQTALEGGPAWRGQTAVLFLASRHCHLLYVVDKLRRPFMTNVKGNPYFLILTALRAWPFYGSILVGI